MDKLHLIPDEVSREKVRKEIERFHSLDKYAGEYHKIATYLDEIFAIPWSQYTEPTWDVDFTTDILEQNIYGLDKVKERIVEMVAVNKLKKSDKFAKGFIILLEGPPGTGMNKLNKSFMCTYLFSFRVCINILKK